MTKIRILVTLFFFSERTPWTQNVNSTHLKRSQDIQEVIYGLKSINMYHTADIRKGPGKYSKLHQFYMLV